MPELFFIRDLIITLLTAFVGGVIFKKMKMPVLLGYLVGGMLIASFFPKFVSTGQTVGNVAEVGVALLLFTIGLEFSLSRLKNLGEVIIFGSLVQVFFCILLFILLFSLFGIDFYSALFLGSVFSLSSTALVLKTLSDKGELETLHGEMASGWLFMQDFYTLPIIILLPTIAILTRGNGTGFMPFFAFFKSLFLAIVSLILIIIIGKTLVPKVIEKIADLKSRELLLIGAVLICLVFAYIFEYFGLSFALGAFVAGILLSSSSANHGIFAEIRPLRDLFSTVFFVSLGFLVNPGYFISHAGILLFFSFLVIFVKFLVSFILVLILKYHTKTAFLVSVSLVSVGEFAFILALLGFKNHLINSDIYMTILSISFISFVIALPFLSSGEKFYYRTKRILCKIHIFKKLFDRTDKSNSEEIESLSDHVVVLGHGRVGKYICHALSLSQIPFIVVDYNHKLVKHLRSNGIKVIYGDPAEIDVLHFARVENAKVVILAYADRHTQEIVVTNVLSINSNAKIIARTHFEEDGMMLKSLGVDAVVQPEFEAAISMTEELLHMVDADKEEIDKRLKNLKREYRLNAGF